MRPKNCLWHQRTEVRETKDEAIPTRRSRAVTFVNRRYSTSSDDGRRCVAYFRLTCQTYGPTNYLSRARERTSLIFGNATPSMFALDRIPLHGLFSAPTMRVGEAPAAASRFSLSISSGVHAFLRDRGINCPCEGATRRSDCEHRQISTGPAGRNGCIDRCAVLCRPVEA